MNRRLKIALIAMSILIGLFVAIENMFSNMLGEAFDSHCEFSQSWTVKGYETDQQRCQDWAGPDYYPIALYKDGKKLSKKVKKGIHVFFSLS